MNSSTVLLLPISHRILAQRENGRFGPEQVLQSKTSAANATNTSRLKHEKETLTRKER
jgi:hypothetical protein